MKKSIFLGILITAFHVCAGQINYKPGYVVKLSGDTIRGEVDYQNWSVNPISISFRTKNTNQEFTVNDISTFSIEGEDVYKRFVVTYQLNTIDVLKAEEEYDESKVTDTVFLRQLVRGKYNLYELNTLKRPYFFIESTSAPIAELVFRVKKSEDNLVREDNQYKDLLLAYAMQENMFEKLQTRMINMSYRSSSLASVVSELNGRNNFDLTIKEKGTFN